MEKDQGGVDRGIAIPPWSKASQAVCMSDF
jgi:hypothetical protein